MAKIYADITVENDAGEITKYHAVTDQLERMNFTGTKEDPTELPVLKVGEYFNLRGVVIWVGPEKWSEGPSEF